MKNNVFSFAIFLFLLFVGCTEQNYEDFASNTSIGHTAFGDSLYYYYHGEKVPLNINSTKYYVVSRNNDNATRSIDSYEGKIIVQKDWKHFNSSRSAYSNLSLQRNIAAIEYVIGDSTPISNIFYIKLKNKSDYTLLKQEAKKIRCDIENIMESDSLWVRLSNNKKSLYHSSLEASNHLFETGLFDDVDPGFIIAYKNNSSITDQYYSDQWGAKRNFLNLEPAWRITKGESNITTAIIDGGIYTQHPDLAGRMHPYSYNCSKESPTNKEHATMIAGIIAANHNSIGVAGVAPNTKLMDIICSMKVSATSSEELANGINKAWQNGADILNLSLGDHGGAYYNDLHSAVLESALNNALSKGRKGKGCVVVFSSGNYKRIDYPAYTNNDFLVVGAINENGNIADFSGRGKELDIVAPGVNILSTNASGGYSFKDGTSFAAPYAAGLAALILSKDSTLKQQQVCELIKKSSKNNEWNINEGYGCISAYNTLSIFDYNSYHLNGPYGNIAYGETDFKLSNIPKGINVNWSSESPFLTVHPKGGAEVTIVPNINEESKTGTIKASYVFCSRTFNITKEVIASNYPKIFGVERFTYMANDDKHIHLKINCGDKKARIIWSSNGDIREFMFAGDASFKDQPSAYATFYVPATDYRCNVKVTARNKYSSDEYNFVIENGNIYESNY